MTAVTVIALGALLGAVLLAIVALMVVQEARRRPAHEPTEFVIEDAASHVAARISGIDRASALRIIEWHMEWVVRRRRAGEAAVLGLTDEAVNYIAQQDSRLDPAGIAPVLEELTGYLVSIGAVGRAF